MDDGLVRLAVPVDEDDHARGPADAPVTLVEYGDFACPYCVVAYRAVRELETRYAGRLRVVFRTFPLHQHPHAYDAAEAAEFAADAGRFWEMHDLLYELGGALDRPELLRCAERLGLDPAALTTALRTQTYRALIEESKEGGEASGIPGTPAFFLNGVLFEEEPTVDAFAHAIDWLLAHGSA